jgi:hypothetical protein
MVLFRRLLIALLALSTFPGCEPAQEFNEEAMSAPYSPTPVKLPASIALPQDVVDNVVVVTVNAPFSQLADAIAYQNEKVNGGYFVAQIDPDAYRLEALRMTAVYQQGITLLGDKTHIRIAEEGVYLVHYQIYAQLLDPPVSSDYSMNFVQVGPGIVRAQSVNYAPNDGDRITISTTALFKAVGANSEYVLYPGAPNELVTLGTGTAPVANRITIVRQQ